MVKFNCSKQDSILISAITERAVKEAKAAGFDYDKLETMMDIIACHANGNPLKLDQLFLADSFNFSHDVCGIRRHINRETGKLENFFRPRFSAP